MLTQSASLTVEFEEFAATLVRSGRYANTNEVLHAAMIALEREECDDEAREAAVREAIEDGLASGLYEGDAFAAVRKELGLPARI